MWPLILIFQLLVLNVINPYLADNALQCFAGVAGQFHSNDLEEVERIKAAASRSGNLGRENGLLSCCFISGIINQSSRSFRKSAVTVCPHDKTSATHYATAIYISPVAERESL